MTIIRIEQSADVGAIHELVRQAFTGHPISQGAEPLIIEALRADGALALSLVAEVDGALVAHIAYSAASIGDRLGAGSSWVLLPCARTGRAGASGVS